MLFAGGALFRYKTPQDDLFVEQILVSGSVVSKSANKRNFCFKIERGGEKIVFQCQDSWDVARWMLQLERYAEKTDKNEKGSPNPSPKQSPKQSPSMEKKRRFSLSKK